MDAHSNSTIKFMHDDSDSPSDPRRLVPTTFSTVRFSHSPVSFQGYASIFLLAFNLI
eukprot:jgi/Psemu1/50858/gm1.50858_g